MRSQPDVKHPYVGGRRWAFMAIDDIESGFNPGKVYIRRWRVFQCPLFAIYLHQIWEPDTQSGREAPFPHNHPAVFRMLILRGGYKEFYWKNPSRKKISMRDGVLQTWVPGSIHKNGNIGCTLHPQAAPCAKLVSSACGAAGT